MIGCVFAIIQFLLITCILLYEYNIKSMSVFLWGTLFVMFGLFHLLSVLLNQLEYPEWVYTNTSIFVILFCILYFITRLLIYSKKGLYSCYFKKNKITPLSNKEYLFVYLLLFILVLKIGITIYNTYQSSGSILASTWGNLLNNSRGKEYINSSRLITPLFFPSTAILFVALFCNSNKKYLYILCLFILLNVVVSRNRIDILPLVCFFLIYYMCNNRLTIINVVFYSLGGFLILYLVYALQDFRYYGSIDNFITNVSWYDFNNSIINRILNQEGELGLRKAFYYFVYCDNNFESFGEGDTYLRMFLFWLPTEFSQGIKPADFAVAMGKAIDPSSWGYSMHPTLFGDCYANFGYAGSLLGLFWGGFVSFFDRITLNTDRLLQFVYAITFSCSYIIIGRGSVYNSFILLLSGLIIVTIIYKLLYKIKL